jgi:hypothetical protein
MKATAIVAACALAFGTAALAQQQDNTARTENAPTENLKPADDAPRAKNALKRAGQKTKHALHRAEDKIRGVAKNDKDRHADEKHARGHHFGDKHARVDGVRDRHARDRDHDRQYDRNARSTYGDDTRLMGAAGSNMRDADMTRRQRMDDAYANWKARQKNG